MDKQRLWAKSQPYLWDNADPRTKSLYLTQHLRDVYQSAMQILDASEDAQLRALGLDPAEWRDRFRRVVLLAAAIHDLGKSGSHFQKMLKERGRQALRHEWVTLLIVDDPEWTQWLLPAVQGDKTDWEIVRWAIAGHHPKYGRSAPPSPEEGPASIRLPLDHADMTEIIAWLGETFGLNGIPPREPKSISLTFEPDNGFDRIAERHYPAEDLFDDFSPELRRFVAAVKDCLVAADVAGSALPRLAKVESRNRWLCDVLDASTLPSADVYRKITATRLDHCKPEDVESKLRPFQKDIAAAPRRVVFVRAGCGTGKTVAAYWWAARSCEGRRLFVCYPTTGTATAGFADYLLDPELAESVKTNLVHGRRAVDFRVLQSDEDRNDTVARIASLDTWRTPVIACTVDTVLGVIQNNRRGLFSWPAIAQAGFVFDEIHSYDDKLFDALLHFLSAVRGVPILLMTASLQASRLKAIRSVLASLGEELAEVPGPENLETVPRYQWRSDIKPKDTKAVDALIRYEIAQGGKVLYVCNTVGEALRTADRLEDLNPFVYHSRFRYCDRVDRHKEVVEAFKREREAPALAICTQVAEMSLDLSATLVVTALAPVPSLIQRLGRLNRVENPECPRPFVVVEPTGRDGKYSPLPYEEDDLKTAQRWLDELWMTKLTDDDRKQATRWLETVGRETTDQLRTHVTDAQFGLTDLKSWLKAEWLPTLGKKEQAAGDKFVTDLKESCLKTVRGWMIHLGSPPLSQRNLADGWVALQETGNPPPRWQSAWLDYGPATPVLELRDGSPTLTVVLEDDWPKLRDPQDATDLAEVALPMPVRPGDDWQLRKDGVPVEFSGVPVAKAASIEYDPQRGGEWR